MNEYNPPVKRWQFGGVAISVLFCGWCRDLNITESGRSANGQLLVLIPGIAVYFWPYGHVPAMALSAAPLKASYQRCFPRRLRLHGNNIYPAAPVKYCGAAVDLNRKEGVAFSRRWPPLSWSASSTES